MELIKPFTSASQAIDLLDNGGKFYNIFTSADDDIISPSEVGKLAGVVFEKQKAVLYLQLALSKLSSREQLEVEGRFDDTLSENYAKFQAETLHSVRNLNDNKISTNVIIRGTVRKIEEAGYVTGFIQIPVVDTFTLIPISETYTVYELMEEGNGTGVLLAHEKSEAEMPERVLTIAGVVKEFQLEESEGSSTQKFIEVSYYAE